MRPCNQGLKSFLFFVSFRGSGVVAAAVVAVVAVVAVISVAAAVDVVATVAILFG